MRKLKALALFLFAALAMGATGVDLNTASRAELTDCAAAGSAAGTLVKGSSYLLRVTDSDVFLCFAESASTCATGGEKFPQGTVMLFTATGDKVSVSCRSAASIGDAIFTSAR